MKSIFRILLLSAMVLFISCDSSTEVEEGGVYPDLSVYEFNGTKNLVTYVCDAGELFKEQGNDAILQFDEEPWTTDSTYLFVFNLDGVLLYNPTDEENIGLSRLDLVDDWGQPFIQDMLDVVKDPNGDGGGWVHYRWNMPKWDDPLWKTSYVKKVEHNGVEYLIGSGIYNMPIEKEFVKEKVLSAHSLIESSGETAFNLIRDSTNIYIFMNTYVFVTDVEGNMLVHPMFPELEGTNMWNDQDSTGKYFVQDFINKAVSDSEGWVTYLWPPDEYSAEEEKHTFVKRAVFNGKTYIIGSGMFYK